MIMSRRLSVVTQRVAERPEPAPAEVMTGPSVRQEPDAPRAGDEDKAGPRGPGLRKSWLVALVIIGVGAVAIFGYAHRKPTAAPARIEAAAPIVELAKAEVFSVQLMPLRHTVHLSGSLRPVNQSFLKAEVAAHVEDVLVREGQPVAKGDVLARLDVADLTSKLNEKLSLLEQAKAQLVLAEKNRTAKLTLREQGYATQTTANEVESAYRVQQANVQAIETQIAVARKAQSDAIIRAPIAGFIGERNVNPGDRVAIDGKLFTIVDLTEMELEAMISANDISHVAVGQNVDFQVPGLDLTRFTGQVVRINPTTKSGTRSIPVYIQVRNDGSQLRGGMFAVGEIVVDRSEPQVAVPIGAVRTEGDARYELKIADGLVSKQRVAVKGEPDSSELIAVTDGLATDDLIISAPAVTLVPGTRVTIGAK